MVKPQAGPVTQMDIARVLGVSQRTVSRVFRDPDSVSPALRESILAAAERLRYRPHSSARAMRTGRFDHVLLVQGCSTMASRITTPLLGSLLAGLERHGLTLGMAQLSDDRLSDGRSLPQAVVNRMCDGMIVNYHTNIPSELSETIYANRIPAVWLNSRLEHDCVHHDDAAAGAMLAREMISRGHRRLMWMDLYLAHTANLHYSRQDRLAGWTRACIEAGVEPRSFLPPAELPADAWAESLLPLLRDPARPTAIAGYSGLEIGAALRAASLAGLSVPQDVALACVGDEGFYIGINVAMALLDMPGLGTACADMLAVRISDPERRQPARVLPPVFRPGASLPS